MTETRKTRILTVFEKDETVERIAPFLSRATMEITHARSPKEGLEAATDERFDMVVASLPLQNEDTETFFKKLRKAHGPERSVPTLLLAEQQDLDLPNTVETPGAHRVSLEDTDDILRATFAEALGVAARLAIRIPVRLEVGIGNGRSFRFCETRNISRSGILISSPRPLQLGADFEFLLTLPYTYTPLSGFGEVVRHTLPQIEQTTGFAARYLQLGKGDSKRLETFIRHEIGKRSAILDAADSAG